jgi:hypothetical protein
MRSATCPVIGASHFGVAALSSGRSVPNLVPSQVKSRILVCLHYYLEPNPELAIAAIFIDELVLEASQWFSKMITGLVVVHIFNDKFQ